MGTGLSALSPGDLLFALAVEVTIRGRPGGRVIEAMRLVMICRGLGGPMPVTRGALSRGPGHQVAVHLAQLVPPKVITHYRDQVTA